MKIPDISGMDNDQAAAVLADYLDGMDSPTIFMKIAGATSMSELAQAVRSQTEQGLKFIDTLRKTPIVENEKMSK